MQWNEVAAHLTGFCHIATTGSDGHPNVAVVSPACEGDVIWVLTTAASRKARNLTENPRISMMWQPGPEVYVQGTVQLLTDLEEKRRIWNSGMLSYDPAMFFGTVENPEMLLVKVSPQSALVLVMSETGPQSTRWKPTSE